MIVACLVLLSYFCKMLIVSIGTNEAYSESTYVLSPARTNFISPVNTCYTFRPYFPSSGIKYVIFKTENKMHIYFECVRSQSLCKS